MHTAYGHFSCVMHTVPHKTLFKLETQLAFFLLLHTFVFRQTGRANSVDQDQMSLNKAFMCSGSTLFGNHPAIFRTLTSSQMDWFKF